MSFSNADKLTHHRSLWKCWSQSKFNRVFPPLFFSSIVPNNITHISLAFSVNKIKQTNIQNICYICVIRSTEKLLKVEKQFQKTNWLHDLIAWIELFSLVDLGEYLHRLDSVNIQENLVSNENEFRLPSLKKINKTSIRMMCTSWCTNNDNANWLK